MQRVCLEFLKFNNCVRSLLFYFNTLIKLQSLSLHISFFSSVKITCNILCIYICLIMDLWFASHFTVVINTHILFSLICLVLVCHYV